MQQAFQIGIKLTKAQPSMGTLHSPHGSNVPFPLCEKHASSDNQHDHCCIAIDASTCRDRTHDPQHAGLVGVQAEMSAELCHIATRKMLSYWLQYYYSFQPLAYWYYTTIKGIDFSLEMSRWPKK